MPDSPPRTRIQEDYESQMAFRKDGVLWGRVAENTFDNFMARQSAANKL